MLSGEAQSDNSRPTEETPQMNKLPVVDSTDQVISTLTDLDASMIKVSRTKKKVIKQF